MPTSLTEYNEQIMIIELNAQLDILEKIISKVQSNLQNCIDLSYLTSESALKIIQNDLLMQQSRILTTKHNTMLILLNKIEKDAINRNNLNG